MFRQLLVVVLVAVAVQAQLEEIKVNSNLHNLLKIARRVATVSTQNLPKATCVKEFSFLPVSKETVDKSQTCLANIESILNLLEKNMKDERDKFLADLKAASETPHDVFDFMQLTARAQQYFQKLFRLTRKDKDAKRDQPKYVNDCVMPVLEEIKKNADAAENKVKECFKKP